MGNEISAINNVILIGSDQVKRCVSVSKETYSKNDVDRLTQENKYVIQKDGKNYVLTKFTQGKKSVWMYANFDNPTVYERKIAPNKDNVVSELSRQLVVKRPKSERHKKGSLSWGERLKAFGRGLLKPIQQLVESPKALAIAAGTTLLAAGIGFFCPAAAPVILKIGYAMATAAIVKGTVQVGLGVTQALAADTADEERRAIENMGHGTSDIVVGVLTRRSIAAKFKKLTPAAPTTGGTPAAPITIKQTPATGGAPAALTTPGGTPTAPITIKPAVELPPAQAKLNMKPVGSFLNKHFWDPSSASTTAAPNLFGALTRTGVSTTHLATSTAAWWDDTAEEEIKEEDNLAKNTYTAVDENGNPIDVVPLEEQVATTSQQPVVIEQ